MPYVFREPLFDDRVVVIALAIPAMSSEYEHVFSFYAKQTTLESSRITGQMLWHQECLNNWQRRGAIIMGRAWNGVPLDL